MAAPRTERLLNLVICLLAATRYVSKEQVRRAVPQYGECATTEAFERMFERDKDDLRDMGIPLETGSNDSFFDDELGYRIPKDAYALPEITFDSEELAVLGLAARTWQHAALSGAAAQAIRKLEAARRGRRPHCSVGHRAACRRGRTGVRTAARRPARQATRDLRLLTRRRRAHPETARGAGAWPRGTAAGTSSGMTSTVTTPESSDCRASPVT